MTNQSHRTHVRDSLYFDTALALAGGLFFVVVLAFDPSLLLMLPTTLGAAFVINLGLGGMAATIRHRRLGLSSYDTTPARRARRAERLIQLADSADDDVKRATHRVLAKTETKETNR